MLVAYVTLRVSSLGLPCFSQQPSSSQVWGSLSNKTAGSVAGKCLGRGRSVVVLGWPTYSFPLFSKSYIQVYSQIIIFLNVTLQEKWKNIDYPTFSGKLFYVQVNSYFKSQSKRAYSYSDTTDYEKYIKGFSLYKKNKVLHTNTV